MALTIGRRGWMAVGLQSAAQVPATLANSDYVPFTNDTLIGMQDQIAIEDAHAIRDKTFNTIAGKQWSEGGIDMLADSKFSGYFVVGALGTVQTTNLSGSVYQHTVTRNNSNTPQYLTVIKDRGGVDRQIFADLTVDEFELSTGTDLAEIKTKLIGNFPQTTTSGTVTTSSGNVFSFKNAQFAFSTTVSGAQSATPLKPHDFKLNIKNNAEAVFAHSQQTPRSINVKQFEASAEMTLYFENTTDRDAYYNQSKQAGSFELIGNGIGSGYNESLTFNFYQLSINSFELETGLDNFYAEKVKMTCEYNPTVGRTLDAVIVNNKSLYI